MTHRVRSVVDRIVYNKKKRGLLNLFFHVSIVCSPRIVAGTDQKGKEKKIYNTGK